MGTTFDVKKELSIYEKVDISKFLQLDAFMRKILVDNTPKKSKAFIANEMQKFLIEAPDEQYLAVKVILHYLKNLKTIYRLFTKN